MKREEILKMSAAKRICERAKKHSCCAEMPSAWIGKDNCQYITDGYVAVRLHDGNQIDNLPMRDTKIDVIETMFDRTGFFRYKYKTDRDCVRNAVKNIKSTAEKRRKDRVVEFRYENIPHHVDALLLKDAVNTIGGNEFTIHLPKSSSGIVLIKGEKGEAIICPYPRQWGPKPIAYFLL